MAQTANVKAGGSTNRFALGYKREATWGVTPAGNFKALRITGESLNPAESAVQSAEIRSDRQISDVVRTEFDATGGVDFEFSAQTFDEFLEAAISDSYKAAVDATTTLDFVALTNTISDGDTSGVFAGIDVGDVFRVSGSSSNNGSFTVATKASNDSITVVQDVADESGDGDERVRSEFISNSTEQITFTLEGNFTDVGVVKTMTGMAVNSLSATVGTGEILTGSVDFVGKDTSYSTAATASTDDAPTTPVMNTITDAREFQFNNLTTDVVLSFSITISNNLNAQRQVGAGTSAAGIRDGEFVVTGSASIYLADDSLLDLFVNETKIPIQFSFIDNNDEGYTFYLPFCRINNAEATAASGNEDALLNFDYQAILSPDFGYTAAVSKFVA